MTFEDSFSPLLHRIDQAIRWRATNPTAPLPPTPQILQKFSIQPEHLQSESKTLLEDLIQASDVKKGAWILNGGNLFQPNSSIAPYHFSPYIFAFSLYLGLCAKLMVAIVPPKVKGRKRNRDIETPLSNLDVEELLRGEKRLKISPENAIPEFKQTLEATEDIGKVKEAVKQMSSIIESQIRHSLGDINYNRAIEGLGTMKDELVGFEEPSLYNEFIRELKKKLLSDQLGGDRREMWWLIRKNRIGLIDNRVSDQSDVTEQEAKEASTHDLTAAEPSRSTLTHK